MDLGKEWKEKLKKKLINSGDKFETQDQILEKIQVLKNPERTRHQSHF